MSSKCDCTMVLWWSQADPSMLLCSDQPMVESVTGDHSYEQSAFDISFQSLWSRHLFYVQILAQDSKMWYVLGLMVSIAWNVQEENLQSKSQWTSNAENGSTVKGSIFIWKIRKVPGQVWPNFPKFSTYFYYLTKFPEIWTFFLTSGQFPRVLIFFSFIGYFLNISHSYLSENILFISILL